MEKFKTIGIVLIKIAIIVFLVVSLNLLMMPKNINENQDGRIIAEMYREKISPDVVFIGSSTVYSGVSPVWLYENYGITSYVCSTSSQVSWNSYHILKEALRVFKPKMVVFDIGFLTESEEYVEEVSNRKAYDYMKNTINKYQGIDRAMDESESKWSYLLPVLRYHARYKDLTFDDVKYMYYKPDVTYNGFIMNKNTSPDIYNEENEWSGEDTNLNDCNRKYLEDIISLCKDKNIDIVLIKTPSYKAKWGANFENDIVSCAAASDVMYINYDIYSDAMGIDWMMDSPDNGRHLNLYGAEKYTYYLGALLCDHYDIPNRSQDLQYANIWNSKVMRYEEDKKAN